jgi:hypothetical protein
MLEKLQLFPDLFMILFSLHLMYIRPYLANSWNRFCHKNFASRWRDSQTSTMGHCWTIKI